MSKKQALVNAGEIIERFGGIRPMAAKIETPVTTVQGWKKRDVIPGTRRTQILDAASKHDIDISDLTKAVVSNENDSKVKTKKAAAKKAPKKTPKQTGKKAGASSAKKSTAKKTTVKSTSNASKKEPVKKEPIKASKTPSVSVPSVSASKVPSSKTPSPKATHDKEHHDRLMSEIQDHNNKAVVTSVWATTGLILLACAAAFLLLWPSLKQNNQRIQTQSEKLVTLEDKVGQATQEKRVDQGQGNFLGTSIPDNIQEKIDGLQNQARNISVTVDQLSQKAKEISITALGENAQGISDRLKTLETKIEDLSGPEGSFAGLVSRISTLEDSFNGKAQLESSANQLRSIVKEPAGTIKQNLAAAQDGVQGALGRTLEGVPGEDLKAAAILIAFSQFRVSLEREEPFEQDLALLQELIGDNAPELQENLQRLSVHADGGVLTASGLSSELKQMTGDIVVSSLKGDDVSIKEKAKARFGSLVQIEKDGEMLSGTPTQATVAKAQNYIEQGQIEDGISALQGLDGSASSIVQPFIEKAKASILAEKVKAMLSENILSKVASSPEVRSSEETNNDFNHE